MCSARAEEKWSKDCIIAEGIIYIERMENDIRNFTDGSLIDGIVAADVYSAVLNL